MKKLVYPRPWRLKLKYRSHVLVNEMVGSSREIMNFVTPMAVSNVECVIARKDGKSIFARSLLSTI